MNRGYINRFILVETRAGDALPSFLQSLVSANREIEDCTSISVRERESVFLCVRVSVWVMPTYFIAKGHLHLHSKTDIGKSIGTSSVANNGTDLGM
jgi:hypothetical protein